MRLKYVSVLRKYILNDRKWCCVVHGELEEIPSSLWLKYFQIFWMSNPSLKELCLEPVADQAGISLPVEDEEKVSKAIDALREVVSYLNNNLQIKK